MNLSRREFFAGATGASALAGAADSATWPRRTPGPNVLIILLDDMGYSDLGFYGGEIRTPNIDALARRGLAFNQFYVFPRCSPTRAALLTGQTPHAVGLGFLTAPAASPGPWGPYQGYLTPGTPTLASLLRKQGYSTYLAGKWHLGEAPEHWPLKNGFDRYFGLIKGANSYFEVDELSETAPASMAADDRPWSPDSGRPFYMTDAITDAAVSNLREHAAARPERPFFLYLAYTAPHWPLHAPEDDIRSYDGDYAEGWEVLRRRREARLRARGFDPRRFPAASPPASIGAWRDYADKPSWQRMMQTYAAMLSRADQGVARVLAELRRTMQLDNTLIFLSSDNGASAEVVKRLQAADISRIGKAGSYPMYGPEGATLAATPFRDFKGTTYEGGIRSPLIVSWPKRIKAARIFQEDVASVFDIMPTILELAHAPPPIGLQGRSFAATLVDGAPIPERAICFEHLGWRANRHGRWKLVRPPDAAWQLYDIAADPGERRDVASAHPKIVEQMSREWEHWASEGDVRPITDPELLNQWPGAHSH